ncbi:MAG: LysE family transporter [Actinomycetia bacterium]|nr:LysE family transporter [Actinomycetes bacterium]
MNLAKGAALVIVQLFVGFSAMLAITIAIGPQNAFVLRQGIKREYVLAVVAVCTFGDGALIATGIDGFSTLLHTYPNVASIARLGGATFLIGYALLAARRALRPAELTPLDMGIAPLSRVVQACLIVTFLNPSFYVDTALIGTLAAEKPDFRWFFGAGAWLASAVWFGTLGFGSGQLQRFFATPAAWRILDGLIAVTMVGVAVVVMTEAHLV